MMQLESLRTQMPVNLELPLQSQKKFEMPVIDMNEYRDPRKFDQFVNKVSEALHDVGFFAVVNPGVDIPALTKGYNEIIQFFRQPMEEKKRLFHPETNGQRGYVPSETAQGFAKMDCKEFLHVGPYNNQWAEGMETLKESTETLYNLLRQHTKILGEAISLAMGKEADFINKLTDGGDSLLRAIHYFKNPGDAPWAAEHTDIDLFTILPMATEKGLQVWYKDHWIDAPVLKDAFIVNAGDMLENLSNGYFKSARHRVVSNDAELERFSIVLFMHAKWDDKLDPQPETLARTGGVRHFPVATEGDLLARRLCEIGLASDKIRKYDSQSGLMDRIQKLVEAGVAANAVKKTWVVYKKSIE